MLYQNPSFPGFSFTLPASRSLLSAEALAKVDGKNWFNPVVRSSSGRSVNPVVKNAAYIVTALSPQN